jgi:hypothetical protein
MNVPLKRCNSVLDECIAEDTVIDHHVPYVVDKSSLLNTLKSKASSMIEVGASINGAYLNDKSVWESIETFIFDRL